MGFCLGSLLASKFFTCLPSRLSQIAIPINTLELATVYSAGTASINDAYELKTTAQKRTNHFASLEPNLPSSASTLVLLGVSLPAKTP